MARHGSIHYVTVGRLKELLNDPKITDNMLLAHGMIGLTICRPGETEETECCCIECVIGHIWLDDEEVVWDD